MMDEVFIRLRDTAIEIGASQSTAIHLARLQQKSLEPLLRPVLQEQISASSRTLTVEVSRQVEQLIRPLAEKARRDIVPNVDDWKAFIEDVQSALMMLVGAALEASPNRETTWRILSLFFGTEGLADYPPLLLPGSSAHLCYWAAAANVADWAAFVFPEWAAYAVNESHKHLLAKIGQDTASTQDRFALALQNLEDSLNLLGAFARLQWEAVGIVGAYLGYLGMDSVQVWYPYAQARMEKARQQLRCFLENPTIDNLPPLCENVQPSNLNWVQKVTDHILHGARLRIPALTRLTANLDGKPIGGQIIINHPLVSLAAVEKEARQIRQAIGDQRHSLSQSDETFLDLVQELGAEPGKRIPKGFWLRFLDEFNKRNPDHPTTVSNLRTRYHRLTRRIKVSP